MQITIFMKLYQGLLVFEVPPGETFILEMKHVEKLLPNAQFCIPLIFQFSICALFYSVFRLVRQNLSSFLS